jgi:hypothetical protein
MQRFRQHLTYANVVSSLALILVVGGGGAYAASHLASNSVGARQLKANSVTGAKVQNGSLTGADINVSTLGEVPSAKSALSAASAPPSGPAGGVLAGAYPNPQLANEAVTFAKLAPGIPGNVHVVTGITGNTSNAEQEAEAKCPKGERVLGGGAFAPFGGAAGFVALTADGPTEVPINTREYDGWTGRAMEVNGGSTQIWGIRVYAICARLD